MKRLLVALLLAVVLSLALASAAFAVTVPFDEEHPGATGIDVAIEHDAPVELSE